MKKKIILSMCLLCAVISLSAQQKFNVQNGTKTVFYDALDVAVQNAAAGDTIYIPGGVIQLAADLVIDKKLALIGVGWDPDSQGGVAITDISARNITFNAGSDGSMLTGCWWGSINIGANVQNITVWRNKIEGQINMSNTDSHITVSENNIRAHILGGGASMCEINNNNIGAWFTSLVNSHIYNNVLRDNYNINGFSGCIVENNYITGNSFGGDHNTVNNNAFSGNYTPGSTDTYNSNLSNITPGDTFTGTDLSLPKNLTLKAGSPCIGAGSEGTEIGIYGGPNPYKVGNLPFNSHITILDVPGTVDKNGNIKVNIEVAAQTR